MVIFRDRRDAGRRLAEAVERLALERPFILGLTRGGVPVAFEIARALETDLDVVVVRKIGAPGFPEYAAGAVAEGGAVWVNPEALRELGLTEEDVAKLAEREAAELSRRVRAFRGDRPAPDLAGRTAVVVDDGVATGSTARAAARAARAFGAKRVVLAAPVIAAESAPDLRREFDDVVAVEFPDPFIAVGLWYEQFDQLSDEDVRSDLRRAWGAPPDRGAGGRAREPRTASHDPQAPHRIEELVSIAVEGTRFGRGALEGTLSIPESARGLVLFAHGSGSTRRSPRNLYVSGILQDAGFATLLFDLLTPGEAAEDAITEELRYDVARLGGRVVAAIRWANASPRCRALRVGLFGANTGAAAALVAAAELPDAVGAVVSRGGRPDLVDPATLRSVRAPTLLVVGGRDQTVLALNQGVLAHLPLAALEVVPGASHLFEEPGALDAVVRLATAWFERHLAATDAARAPSPG